MDCFQLLIFDFFIEAYKQKLKSFFFSVGDCPLLLSGWVQYTGIWIFDTHIFKILALIPHTVHLKCYGTNNLLHGIVNQP